MKFSVQWLREWVNPPLNTHELASQLTMAGLEVEAVDNYCTGLNRVVVSRVAGITNHPSEPALRICSLQAGDHIFSVVSGAPEIRSGACYALALPGAILPGGNRISASEIKGQVSEGMLCSGAELGLNEDSECLLELDQDADVGVSLEEYLCLQDEIIELSLTPNRGDCLGILGIAREVGVLNRMQINPPALRETAPELTDSRAVELEVPAACPRYLGRVIRGIDIQRKTPDWIIERLRRSGLRCINIVVDLTNYILLELGQPMHAFDHSLLTGGICVRLAREGERLELLDGQDCRLATNTLVITDASGPIAMAGIMGGQKTAVSMATTDIFLESAYFSPDAIQGRSRQYNLHTDSSHRYERGVDFTLQQIAMNRATELILNYCGGKAGPVTHACETEHLPSRKPIRLRASRLEQVLGTRINPEKCTEILNSLKMFVIADPAGWQVRPPPFRFDINIEVDLIEEIARINSYEAIPSTGIPANLRITQSSSKLEFKQIKQVLVSHGYQEAISYSFIDGTVQNLFSSAVSSIRLSNPISSELGEMRQSLWPGLLMALAHNIKRQQSRVRLFEVGRIFKMNPNLEQRLVIAGISYGNIYPKQFDKNNISSNFYDMKTDLEAIIAAFIPTNELQYKQSTHQALHPGRSAEIFINNQYIGSIGSIHPGILKQLEIPSDVYAFELELLNLPAIRPIKYVKISKYPSIRRDLAVVLDEGINYENIAKCVQNQASDLLENLELFDVYQGEGIDIGKKSLALGLTFQGTSSTLTDGMVEELLDKVLSALNTEFGATLRE